MTINSDILIKNGTATMPDRFVWTRRSNDNDFSGGSKDLIMLSSDIALVRDFEGKTDEVTKAVECKFIFYIPYPFAQQTGQIAAQYRNNNGKWVNDFRDTLNLMVIYGYDSSYDEPPPAECTKCLTKVDFSISRPPTSLPTFTPSRFPTDSPTYARTRRPTNAPSKQPQSRTRTRTPTIKSTKSPSYHISCVTITLLVLAVHTIFF